MSQEPARLTSPTHTSGAAARDSVSQLLHDLDAVRQARSENRVRLLDDVDGIRRRRRRACVRLLQELTPHLHAARSVERELDRHLARRFNAFRYLRDDELGLSQIVADLLDPTAEHGQDTTFLKAMLELLEAPDPFESGRSREAVSGGRSREVTWQAIVRGLRSTAAEKIRVVRERGTGGRFIDITVDIPTDDGVFCLAFENKPYADDQPGQCRDYLEFLNGEYRGRFLLVYLPSRYRMPDKSSLPPADRERWKNHFRVLPYVVDDAALGDGHPSHGEGVALARPALGEDDLSAEDDATDHNGIAVQDDPAVGDGASLADWFGTCCKLTDAERLRWFLREAQLFCQYHFGDSTMTDTEARYIRQYLEENPKHLHAAFAVARAWPALTHGVCRRFLEHLTDRVEEQVRNEFPGIADDLDIGCHYGGDKRYSNYLRLYRYGWVRDEVPDLRSDGRTAVMLQCGTGGPTSWHWGVRCAKSKGDMTEPEKHRRGEVVDALMRSGLSDPDDWHWPHIRRPRYQDWSAMVPELVQELADGGGKVTDYYVHGLLRIAGKAIPAIDEVELETKNASASADS